MLLAIGTLELVGDGVRSDAVKPGGERGAAPFIGWEVGERLVKDFRRKILGGGAVMNAADDEKVNALEILLISIVAKVVA